MGEKLLAFFVCRSEFAAMFKMFQNKLNFGIILEDFEVCD